MSLTNPNTPISQQDLQNFYHKILPYLGGSADAGFTPVGSVIAIMGVTAPANYLACNGQIVNVADYPELANYFEQQFGTKYKFGGSGTTFGIPDLRGEFLRGTGTNSHTDQGSGANVGIHQDGTGIGVWARYDDFGFVAVPDSSSISDSLYSDEDSIVDVGARKGYLKTDYITSQTDATAYVVPRPTNTSVLFCIATKDIFLNPSMDFSTNEKVVGKWLDGSTLYQKTFSTDITISSASGWFGNVDVSGCNIDEIKSSFASGTYSNQKISMYPVVRIDNGTLSFNISGMANVVINQITIQYTKTT